MEYIALAEFYENLEKTTKRLEKTFYLSEFLKKVPAEDLDKILLLVQGKIFPTWEEKKIGVAAKLILKTINVASGIDLKIISKDWSKTGDLGITTEHFLGRKKQATLFSKALTVEKVFNNLQKLPEPEGHGSVDKKTKLIAELLTSATPLEARYIVRTVLEELRIGLGEGTIRDAIVWAFFGGEIGLKYDKNENKLVLKEDNREKYNQYLEPVQEAYDIANDFGVVAKAIKTHGLRGLKKISIAPGKPLKVMLFQKAKDLEDAFETVGKPAEFEFKYDGVRMEVHKFNDKIVIFTRRLENVTAQFPEIVEIVRKDVKGDSFILDCEGVGFNKKTGKYLPFQNISQRIKRKYDIKEMADKFPVELNVFDIVYYNGKSLLKEPFEKRRDIIEKIIKQAPKKIVAARHLITDDIKKAEKFYKEALDKGNEGVMAKNLKAVYKPGSRVGYGVKVKPVMENLDLVIIGAEWGEGKRAGWLTSFHIACMDEDGNLLEVGKVATGLKEKTEEGISYEQMTKLLKPLITSQKGKHVNVKPNVVIEVGYSEIQKSPTYTSGYALRFPRFIRLREERSPEDISSLKMVEEFYKGQKK